MSQDSNSNVATIQHGKLANMDMDKAINDLANGRMLKDIASDYGCDKSAVYRKLVKHPGYKAALEAQALQWIEDAMEDVRTCDQDSVNIARARVDAAFRYAKARHPDFADRQDVAALAITVNVAPLGERVGVTIEGVAEPVSAKLSQQVSDSKDNSA